MNVLSVCLANQGKPPLIPDSLFLKLPNIFREFLDRQTSKLPASCQSRWNNENLAPLPFSVLELFRLP